MLKIGEVLELMEMSLMTFTCWLFGRMEQVGERLGSLLSVLIP